MIPNDLTALFSATALTSWRAAWLILFVVALRLIVRGRIPAQVWFIVWIVVALRLLLPFSVSSAWSPYNLMGDPPAIAAAIQEPIETKPAPAAPMPPAVPVAIAPIIEVHSAAPTRAPAPAIAAPPASQPADSPAWQPLEVAALVWLGGAATLIVVRLVGSLRFRMRLRVARTAADARLLQAVERETGRGARRAPACVETDAVEAPALFGIIRPRLLFPIGFAATLSDDELQLVVRHELGHWRRRDLLAQTLVQLAVICHWFNPLVWLAARLARADCELACDEFVLRRVTPAGAHAYGATLLKVVSAMRGRRRPMGGLAIVEGKQLLAQRLRMIAGYRATTFMRVAGGVTLLIVLAVVSITREVRAEQHTNPSPAAPAGEYGLPAVSGSATKSEPELQGVSAATRFLRDQAEGARDRLAQLRSEFQAFKERNNITSLDHQRGLVQERLRAGRVALDRARAMLAEAELRISQIAERRARNADLAELPFVANQPLVQELVQQLAAKRLEAAALAERYTERHPRMIETTNALAQTQRELQRAMDAAAAQVEAELQIARHQNTAAENELELRQREAVALNRLAVEYNNRERELQAQAQILERILLRGTEAAIVAEAAENTAAAAGEITVSVVGAVHRQGAYRLSSREKPVALDAIARAGGFAATANRAAVRILRSAPDGSRTTLPLTETAIMNGVQPESLLENGDILIVAEHPPVTPKVVIVVGAVNSPGRFAVHPGEKNTVLDLIARAGGASNVADLKRVRVTRINVQTREAQAFVVDADAFMRARQGPNADWRPFITEDGDAIFVPERIL